MRHIPPSAILLSLALALAAQARAKAPAVPGIPTPLDPQGKTVLMAEDALAPVPGIALANPSGKPYQHFYMVGKQAGPKGFEWKVKVPADGDYEVELVSQGVSQAIVTGGAQPLQATLAAPSAWSRSILGTVKLQAGERTLSLQVPKDNAVVIRSLDLIPVAAQADYLKRVAALRSDTAWMREGKYGVMLQYGSWGYPQHGEKTPWEEVVKKFDVEKFAKMVDEDMGAKWVIWSITWRGSHFPMPLKSVDAIVPGHTTVRDLPLDLAAALKKRGIKLMFYYHPGHEDPAWWAANWGKDDGHGHGDKARFLKNWQAVVSEIGDRYGDDLAGWFFDDGVLYSPAPFEALTQAAKSGSPKRLVSYNSWVLPTLTDFQDVHMAEMAQKFYPPNPADMDERGIYKSGPYKGNQSHEMCTVNNDGWGVWKPNSAIPLTMGAPQAIGMIKMMAKRGQPVSLNFDMYEDGTVTEPTLDMFRRLKKAIRSAPPLPLSEDKPATASGQWPGNYGADKAVDGDAGSFWAMANGEKAAWLEVDLGKPQKASRAVIQEVCTAPRQPLVGKFVIEARQADGAWKTVAEGDGIGAEKELKFAPAQAQKFRLRILDFKHPASSVPVIGEFQLFAQ